MDHQKGTRDKGCIGGRSGRQSHGPKRAREEELKQGSRRGKPAGRNKVSSESRGSNLGRPRGRNGHPPERGVGFGFPVHCLEAATVPQSGAADGAQWKTRVRVVCHVPAALIKWPAGHDRPAPSYEVQHGGEFGPGAGCLYAVLLGPLKPSCANVCRIVFDSLVGGDRGPGAGMASLGRR